MSEYCSTRTQFKSQDALIAALMETGQWSPEQIEVHKEAQNLHGYHGDQRVQQAHIIIRRQHVQASANDIGYERMADGMFRAHISAFDTRTKYGEEWQRELKRNYAFHATRIDQQARGREVVRERLPDGRQRVLIGGYR